MAEAECDYFEDDGSQRMVELRRSEPDQRDAVQKKTFTKWVNNHLQKANVRILDLYEELRDGNNLLLLIELLCDRKLPRERGQLRFHRLQNVRTALEFLESQKIKLVNIRSDAIVDGNPKLTLGLIWTIILHFQISEVDVVGRVESMTAKDALLWWSQKVTQGYPAVSVENFTYSWMDGLAFNAIIHRYRPDLVDFSKLNKDRHESNLEYAFNVAEKEFEVPRLLDVEDLAHSEHPDEKSIMTYVAALYEIFPKEPTVQETLFDNEKMLKFGEYCDLAKQLVLSVREVIIRLERQKFPKAIQAIKDLIAEYNRYRILEFPEMEASRHSLKMCYKELQLLYGPMTTWLDFPKDCSPRDLEVLWSRLVDTQDTYNKSLRVELTRLEQMSHVAEKIRKEATIVGASLDDIEERIKSEEQFGDKIEPEKRRKQNYQIEKALVMFETSICHMLSGVDILKAGRYHRAEEIKIIVENINRRWHLMKARLDSCSSQVHVVQTSPGKKMKLEMPIQQTHVSTEESSPDGGPVRTTRKVITVTKRTTRTAGGTPTDSSTTVTRILSDGTLSEGGSVDSGISPGSSPHGKKLSKLQFNLEGQKFADKHHLIDAMSEWIRETKVAVEKAAYGLDLPSSQKFQQVHHGQHEAILAFQAEVDKVEQFGAQDPSLSLKIRELQDEFSELATCSVNRVNNLKSLVEFMSEATKELIWMNQREDAEVSRDWARTDFDLNDLKAHGENLLYDVDDRKPYYRRVIAKGERLIVCGHPTPGPIEAYMNAMKSQWCWINELTSSFHEHLRNTDMYYQFFSDSFKAEQKLVKLVNELNTAYDVQHISSKPEAEKAAQGLMVRSTTYRFSQPFL